MWNLKLIKNEKLINRIAWSRELGIKFLITYLQEHLQSKQTSITKFKFLFFKLNFTSVNIFFITTFIRRKHKHSHHHNMF
jgi:hypothetical protein